VLFLPAAANLFGHHSQLGCQHHVYLPEQHGGQSCQGRTGKHWALLLGRCLVMGRSTTQAGALPFLGSTTTDVKCAHCHCANVHVQFVGCLWWPAHLPAAVLHCSLHAATPMSRRLGFKATRAQMASNRILTTHLTLH
jgi:hypothetical protein